MIDILSLFHFGIGALFIIFSFYELFKQRNKVFEIFSFLCLAIAIYVIGYGFELQSDSLEEIKFFLKMQYFGLPFIIPFWLLFMSKFYFKQNLSLRLRILLFIIPTLTLFFSTTNEYHHWLYKDISIIQYNDFLITQIKKGPWFLVNVIYCYILFFTGLGLIYRSWRKWPYNVSIEFWFLFIGILFPGLFELINFAGLSPFRINLVPFGMSLMAICYYIALFQYDFFDLNEIARSFIFSKINEGIIVLDKRNRLLDFNNIAREVFPWTDSKNIGIDVTNIPEAKEIIEHKGSLFEIEILHKDKPRQYELRVMKLQEKNKRLGSIYFIRDITDQKEMIRKLNDMANYDFLTQIYNRRKFLEEAEIEVVLAKKHRSVLSVLMIDIDYFKKVNDLYGHFAGDEVIKSIVTVCKESVHSTDLVGRYGGEEFVILLPGANIENAKYIAEHIRKHIENMEISYNNDKINVTVSIGVASVDCNIEEDFDIYKLINKADMALYHAKTSGRNRVSCYE